MPLTCKPHTAEHGISHERHDGVEAAHFGDVSIRLILQREPARRLGNSAMVLVLLEMAEIRCKFCTTSVLSIAVASSGIG